MKSVVEEWKEGRWSEIVSFTGENLMGKARENFNHILRTEMDRPIRLIIIHAHHDGTSESAAKLLK